MSDLLKYTVYPRLRKERKRKTQIGMKERVGDTILRKCQKSTFFPNKLQNNIVSRLYSSFLSATNFHSVIFFLLEYLVGFLGLAHLLKVRRQKTVEEKKGTTKK